MNYISHQFEAFMQDVWRMDLTPIADGARLSGHPEYARYSNARNTAVVKFGGRDINQRQLVGDKYGRVLQFPDNSRAVVHRDAVRQLGWKRIYEKKA